MPTSVYCTMLSCECKSFGTGKINYHIMETANSQIDQLQRDIAEIETKRKLIKEQNSLDFCLLTNEINRKSLEISKILLSVIGCTRLEKNNAIKKPL